MSNIDKMANTSSYNNLSKREKLQVSRERAKLEKNLGSIADMSRLPAALFVVDINKEKIAVAEARKLNIPIFAMADTNTDPNLVDFAIPANDDASKSISIIVNAAVLAVAEGLKERKLAKEKDEEEAEALELATDIKAKSQTLAQAEEEADKEAEKGKKEVKSKKSMDDDEKPAKSKRPRKPITKKK
jgi:small subunit ribosomal protein S2